MACLTAGPFDTKQNSDLARWVTLESSTIACSELEKTLVPDKALQLASCLVAEAMHVAIRDVKQLRNRKSKPCLNAQFYYLYHRVLSADTSHWAQSCQQLKRPRMPHVVETSMNAAVVVTPTCSFSDLLACSSEGPTLH